MARLHERWGRALFVLKKGSDFEMILDGLGRDDASLRVWDTATENDALIFRGFKTAQHHAI